MNMTTLLFTIAFSFACFVLPVSPLQAQSTTETHHAKKETVVILHGIARSSKTMKKMELFFKEHGYKVINIDYNSRAYTLDKLAKNVHDAITPQTSDPETKLHFIAHSMGGLVVRALITQHRPKNLGRVVMLGTPNQGSEVADFLKNNFIFQGYYGPAGLQLSTDQRSIKKLLGKVDYPLGIIAGDLSIDPVSSIILPGVDDGKVSIARTKINGMHDHIVLHTTHTFMMKNDKVLKQAHHFLQHGAFDHKASKRVARPEYKFNE